MFNKEKNKLHTLLQSIITVDAFSEPNLEVLNEAYLEYAKIIRSLFKVRPNVFANLLNYDLVEIKKNKRFLKESYSEQAQKDNFIDFKESIVHAIERTVDYISDYIEL